MADFAWIYIAACLCLCLISWNFVTKHFPFNFTNSISFIDRKQSSFFYFEYSWLFIAISFRYEFPRYLKCVFFCIKLFGIDFCSLFQHIFQFIGWVCVDRNFKFLNSFLCKMRFFFRFEQTISRWGSKRKKKTSI